MKCKRPNCPRTVNRQGLCHLHYRHAPVRGYVDSGPTKARIELLLSLGYGWARLEAEGVSPQWWRQLGPRVQALKEAHVLAIPVPERIVSGGAISAVGTVRRIQALAAMGWPFTVLGPRVGHCERYLSQLLRRDRVWSSTAAKIDTVYRELGMVPGPSNWVRVRARRKGWVTAAAWDNVDDPDEQPNTGVHAHTTASERIRECREDLGITDIHHIADRLGIQVSSVERQMDRNREDAA